MLLRFRFSNYRSFRGETEFSLVATRQDRQVARRVRKSSVTGETIDILPIVAVLGANASGKSNLLRAMVFMRQAVTGEYLNPEKLLGTRRDYFLLDPKAADENSMFEVDFIYNGDRFQYGFELNDEIVVSEWLHSFPYNRTQTLFDREGGDYQFGRRLGGPNRAIVDITRPNALFLSAAALSNHELLGSIYQWFAHNLEAVEKNPASNAYMGDLLGRIPGHRERISRFVRLADLGIAETQLVSVKRDMPGVRADLLIRVALAQERLRKLETEQGLREFGGMQHEAVVYQLDAAKQQLRMVEHEQVVAEGRKALQLKHHSVVGVTPLPYEEESLGTQTWIALVAHTLEALDTGGSLLVDELDASLHPLLMGEVLRLFSDAETNPHGAQLIFTTHDTTTLGTMTGNQPLSRGQVWFAEKDREGSSRLTPLTDYRPRKGENVERGYLQGRYGGTPQIRSFETSESDSNELPSED